MKVVINRCFGGFSLSTLAYETLMEKHGWKASGRAADGMGLTDPEAQIVEYGEKNIFFRYCYAGDDDDLEFRTNADVISVVEELGEGANGAPSSLKIVEVPDGVDVEITNHDGMETVREKSRGWF